MDVGRIVTWGSVGAVGGLLMVVWAADSEYQTQTGRIDQLERQVRALEDRMISDASEIANLKDQARVIGGKVRTLGSIMESATSALTKISNITAFTVDSLKQKYVELTDQANSPYLEINSDFYKKATALMKELNCASMMR